MLGAENARPVLPPAQGSAVDGDDAVAGCEAGNFGLLVHAQDAGPGTADVEGPPHVVAGKIAEDVNAERDLAGNGDGKQNREEEVRPARGAVHCVPVTCRAEARLAPPAGG
jgi:hypothetical protein